MKVRIKEMSVHEEGTLIVDGIVEECTTLLSISYDVKLEGNHELNGQVVVPYEDFKDMSISEHEEAIKRGLIERIKESGKESRTISRRHSDM